MRGLHKPPDSLTPASSTVARKSGQVSHLSYKVAELLTSVLSFLHSSPSQLRAPDSITSLTSLLSRPPLKATDSLDSLSSISPQHLDCESRAGSPDTDTQTHISVSESEGEVELGMSTIISLPFCY